MLRYAITDRARFSAESGEQAEESCQAVLLAQAARLADEGIDFIQLREKDLSAGALADLARRLMEVLRTQNANSAQGSAPKLLINSRADVAVAARADGVHLTSSPGALTPAQVRALYVSAGLPEPIVSVSCHSLADVARSRADAASYILFGPVFEKVVAAVVGGTLPLCQGKSFSRCEQDVGILCFTQKDTSFEQNTFTKKISEGSGLDLLRAACIAAAPIPVFALGGITSENTGDCLAAGVAGIAAIRLFL
jgi:thiamine-phosphate pyrophosphorylase